MKRQISLFLSKHLSHEKALNCFCSIGSLSRRCFRLWIARSLPCIYRKCADCACRAGMSSWEFLSEDQWPALSGDSPEAFLLYKHSPLCPVSTWAKRALQSSKPLPWRLLEVDVLAQRELSQDLARWLGVHHESPQLILVVRGKAEAHVSHDSVNGETIQLWAQTF
jgi:bacillithiol system protein YtxJ